jgi:hypothetical protein
MRNVRFMVYAICFLALQLCAQTPEMGHYTMNSPQHTIDATGICLRVKKRQRRTQELRYATEPTLPDVRELQYMYPNERHTSLLHKHFYVSLLSCRKQLRKAVELPADYDADIFDKLTKFTRLWWVYMSLRGFDVPGVYWN